MKSWSRLIIAAGIMLASTGVRAGQVVVPIAPPPPPALSVQDACCVLKDLPAGEHQLTFIHPCTCCPVTVCVCLPCGCYELKCSTFCGTHKLRFNYPGLGNDVVIKFKKDGSVKVND